MFRRNEMRIIDDQLKLKEYIYLESLNHIINEDMEKYCEIHTFERGEFICKVEQEVEYFYFFVEGKAKIYTLLENGNKLLLRFYQPFNILGDIELLLYPGYRTYVEALRTCICLGIPMRIIRAHFLHNSVFIKFLCEHLARKLDSITHKSSMNLYPLEVRLSRYIFESQVKEDDKMTIIPNYNDLAELLGSSYRHLNRTFNQLIEKGIISKKGKRITILDKEALTEIAGDIMGSEFYY